MLLDYLVPRHDPTTGLRTIRAHVLRHAVLLELLRAGRPLRLVEIVERLAAIGYVPFGRRPTQAVWNALRSEQFRGRVARAGHGTYEAVPAAITPGHLRWARHVLRLAAAAEAAPDGALQVPPGEVAA